MDFLDPVKKRHHRNRLFVGYILVAIAVLAVAYLLILQTYGFDYNRETGQVIQNGLVFLQSHPVSADIYLNGQHKGKTTTRLTIPAGQYNVVIKSSGYRDWATTFNLAGGDIEQLDYPLLVPNQLKSTDVQVYPKVPTLASSSPDRHWLIVQAAGTVTEFQVFDLTNPSLPPTTINIPSNLLKATTGYQSDKVVEWSSDNRNLLMEHDFKGGKEFFVLDSRTPNKSVNINNLFNISPTSMVLRDKKADQYYAYIFKTKTLLAVTTTPKQVTTVLKNVINFKTYKADTIVYTSDVSNTPGAYAVEYWDGSHSYLLHNYPAKTDYKLDMAVYSGQTYIAVAPVSTNRLYLYKNPINSMRAGLVPNPFIALRIDSPQFISFSTSARFIAAQNAGKFVVYDFEEDLQHHFSLTGNIPATDKATWMDGFRLAININGKINICEFNAENKQVLTPSLTGFDSYFNSDYSSYYSITLSQQNPKQFAVVRTAMVAR